MSSALCQSCGRKSISDAKSKEAHDQMTKEATSHLEFLNNAILSHLKLKEDVQQNLQDNFIQNEKYVLCNKIAYFSMKSIEQRRDNVSVIKRLEKKKIKIMEKSVQINDKLSKLKQLQTAITQREETIRLQQQTGRCLDSLNRALLYPLLDYSRLRLVIDAFVKFPIHCRADASTHLGTTQNSSRSEHITPQGKISLSLTGVSSILGLPLPDSGEYKCSPPAVVCSALAHVAHLLTHVASVLNMPLPHPLLPFDTFDFAVIKPYGDLTRHIPLTPAFKPAPGIPSLSSHPSLATRTHSITTDPVGSTTVTPAEVVPKYQSTLFLPSAMLEAQRGSDDSNALLWNHPLPAQEHEDKHKHKENRESAAPLSAASKVARLLTIHPDPDRVRSDQDFDDVKDDILQDNIFQTQLQDSGLHWIINPDFASGLLLLQANVVHLCLTIGLSPQDLWPPQALLLNMHLLYRFCLSKTMQKETQHPAAPRGQRGDNNTGTHKKDNIPTPSSPLKNTSTVMNTSKQENQFKQLGQSLKAYCEAIQAKPNSQPSILPTSVSGGDSSSELSTHHLLAANRSRHLHNIEAHFYSFDSRKFQRQFHVDSSGTSSPLSLSNKNGEYDIEDNDAGDDHDMVHVSFDYEESDDEGDRHRDSEDSYSMEETDANYANTHTSAYYAYEEDSCEEYVLSEDEGMA